MRKLTTTSYAVLGLLTLRSWSTYELAQQVHKSLRSWWPRTERQLYEQPKILVDHGLATAKADSVGRRPRTVYSITPAGRTAFRRWLSEPSEPYAFEWDALLRVFFAEQGTKEQLLATLRDSAQSLRDCTIEDVKGFDEVYAANYRYADRAHLFAIMAKLEFDVYAAIDTWLEWAQQEIETWPDSGGPPDGVDLFRHVVAASTAAIDDRARS